MKHLILITTLLVSLPSFAQEMVLDNAPQELYKELRGPASKHYFHPYISFGMIPDMGENSRTQINTLLSNEYSVGLRYKRKVLSFYQIGLDLSGRFLQYRIKAAGAAPGEQNPFHEFWDDGKQNLRTNSLGLEFYNRLRAGKGNNLGYYIDIGIRGDWNYMNKHVIRSRYDKSENFAGRVKNVNRKLAYMEATSLSVSGRIGLKKTIFYGSYRLTDLFKDNYPIPELPVMIFGVQRAI